MPRRALLLVAAALLATSAPAFAAQLCHADRTLLRNAVKIVVASYKCNGFKDALYAKRHQVFLSESGAIDQATGACERELAEARDAESLALLKDRTGFCQAVTTLMTTDSQLRQAAVAAGVW
mgnify:CR=1 FL=1